MDETVVDVAFVLIGFALLMFGGEALVQGCLLYTSDAADE